MRDAKSVLRRLHENPDEAEFRNRTSRQLRNSSQSQLANPTGDSSMEFLLQESQRYQGVHVEKIRHGNSDKISRTCLLLYGGAGEVRTPDLRFRKPTLYPSELQPHDF